MLLLALVGTAQAGVPDLLALEAAAIESLVELSRDPSVPAELRIEAAMAALERIDRADPLPPRVERHVVPVRALGLGVYLESISTSDRGASGFVLEGTLSGVTDPLIPVHAMVQDPDAEYPTRYVISYPASGSNLGTSLLKVGGDVADSVAVHADRGHVTLTVNSLHSQLRPYLQPSADGFRLELYPDD